MPIPTVVKMHIAALMKMLTVSLEKMQIFRENIIVIYLGGDEELGVAGLFRMNSDAN